MSRLDTRSKQLALIQQDLDIPKFQTVMRGMTGVDLSSRIIDATVNPTIEGATTLTVDIEDSDHSVLRSGRLAARLDVELEGLWWRLVGTDISDDNQLTLTFENREVSILRLYNKTRIASRTKMTRAEFIRVLVREPHEFKIPYVIPELLDVQPVEATDNVTSWGNVDPNKGMGLPKDNNLTVKGSAMTEIQRRNADAILDVGTGMVLPRRLLVIALMTAIQESSITNLPLPSIGDSNFISPVPDANPRGVFQQIAIINGRRSSWPASGDVAKDARGFFDALVNVVRSEPGASHAQLAEDVQHSGLNPDSTYGRHRTEAERIVSAYGMLPTSPAEANAQDAGSGSGGDYHYFRGRPPTNTDKKWQPENSWQCILRLAEEVQWRAFFVGGVFYYMSEGRLFSQRPMLTIDHDTVGVEGISGQYANNTKVATVTIKARLGKWQVPQGSVVVLKNMGPYNGRWLVGSLRRSYFDSLAEVSLIKPRPKLPEPAQDQLQLEQSWANPTVFLPDNSPEVVRAKKTDNLSAKNAAEKILRYYNLGKFSDDNGQQVAQLRAAAAGKSVRSQCGHDIFISPLVLNRIADLLDNGFLIGTFAICSDHHCNDGQHPKGLAVDISSVGTEITGRHVVGDGNPTTTAVIKQVMKFLQPFAWDLICNGNGSADPSVQQLQMDNAHPRGGSWATDHTNHIHFGAAPRGDGTPGE